MNGEGAFPLPSSWTWEGQAQKWVSRALYLSGTWIQNQALQLCDLGQVTSPL